MYSSNLYLKEASLVKHQELLFSRALLFYATPCIQTRMYLDRYDLCFHHRKT
jgi:hypothetical protein